MERKYSEELLEAIKEKQYTEEKLGVNILYKPIPDCNIKGAMDPRVYEGAKSSYRMMKFMPKGMMKMDASPKSIERLRKIFNGIKSIPITSDKIEIIEKKIKGIDENEIPIWIYLPENVNKQTEVLYYMHGGGFFGGHHGVVEQFIKLIVERYDIIAVSIDYRLAPENSYPASHEDCYSGLKWVYDHIEEFGGDKSNIFVAGDSAGGNLAQYCSTRNLEDNKKMVKGQILLYPTLNMGGIKDEFVNFNLNKFEMYEKHSKILTSSLLMMGSEDGMGSLLDEILGISDSMNNYLTPYMIGEEKLKNMPDTLISVGEHDALYVESLAFAKKLVEAGVETEMIIYKGMGHAYADNVGVNPQSEDCAYELGEFIKAHAGK